MSNTSKQKVVIIGGGVAGLSAAHELLKNTDFIVDVYEKSKHHIGGKARSVINCVSNAELPAEHGFRFFPGFYKNITAVMKEIPAGNNNKFVYDNLRPVSFYTFLYKNGNTKPFNIPTRIGYNLKYLRFDLIIRDIKNLRKGIKDAEIDITPQGFEYFSNRVYQLFTSCESRYLLEYERIGWSEFIEANNPNFGKDYKSLFAEGLTKNLVAARADKASTRTGGKILAHMLWQIVNPFSKGADRVLNGPTNDAWLHPWKNYMETQFSDRFNFYQGYSAENLIIEDYYNPKSIKKNAIHSAIFNDGEKEITVKGDFYLICLPIERIASLIKKNDPVFKEDPPLYDIKELRYKTEWMNGIIFYLNKKVNIADAHVTIADSDWAITIFSQLQYWEQKYINQLPEYKGQKVHSILSVIISNWKADSIKYPGKKVQNLTKDEVKNELWEQICQCYINGPSGPFKLTEADLIKDFTYVDEALQVDERATKFTLKNDEPLLVNSINTLGIRPDAYTRLENLFLAADYVKAHADLANMDTANETARRAVNSIISKAGGKKSYSSIGRYNLPTCLTLFTLPVIYDHWRHTKGLPWKRFEPTYKFFLLTFRFLKSLNNIPKLLGSLLLICYLLLVVLPVLLLNMITIFFIKQVSKKMV